MAPVCHLQTRPLARSDGLGWALHMPPHDGCARQRRHLLNVGCLWQHEARLSHVLGCVAVHRWRCGHCKRSAACETADDAQGMHGPCMHRVRTRVWEAVANHLEGQLLCSPLILIQWQRGCGHAARNSICWLSAAHVPGLQVTVCGELGVPKAHCCWGAAA